VGHPRQPVIIDATITEEYVICSDCQTKNRVVSHKKALRPICGRCGHPLPDPFGAQPRIRSLGKQITRHSRALAAIAGLLLVGLFVWLVTGNQERGSLLSGPQTHPPDIALADHHGEPMDAVAFVVRRERAADNDERGDVPAKSLSLLEGPQVDIPYGAGTPHPEILTGSESVVIVIDVCASRAQAYTPAGGGRDGELPSVSVVSELRPMKGDPLNAVASPNVVEQIHIHTVPGPVG